MSDDRWCRHGTYIGDPYGPDYMCHYCEAGYSDEEYEAMRLWDLKRPILQTLFRQNARLRVACNMLAVARQDTRHPSFPEQVALIDRYSRSTD